MNASLNLVHLKCFLRDNEEHCLAQLNIIQQTRAEDNNIPPLLREGMAACERQLIREVNQWKRALNTTLDTTVVALVSGGAA